MKFTINTASYDSDKIPLLVKKAYLEKDRKWCVDIDTLDELMKLIDEVGTDIIINSCDNNYCITIYDTYIE